MWSVQWILVLFCGYAATMRGVTGQPEMECDVGETEGYGLDAVQSPSHILTTYNNLTKQDDCYRECCAYLDDPVGICTAVSFERTRDSFKCILLHCVDSDSCIWAPVPSAVRGRIDREEETDDLSSPTGSPDNNGTPQNATVTDGNAVDGSSADGSSVDGNSTEVNSADGSSADISGANDDEKAVDDNTTMTSNNYTSENNETSSTTTTTSSYVIYSTDEAEKEEIEEEEEEWDQLWEALWDDDAQPTPDLGSYQPSDEDQDQYPEIEEHGEENYLPTRPSSSSDEFDSPHGKFDSAYLGSFSDSSVDSPALIIGATATILFAVVVLICVGLKFSNRQRSKYKPLREEESFNSNSVNQPLTGGYETYE